MRLLSKPSSRTKSGALSQSGAARRRIPPSDQRVDSAPRLTEQGYRSVFENAVFGVFQTTPDGRFITANSALARILGYESAQELIETVTDIAHQIHVDPERRSEFRRILQESGAVHNFEARAYRKDRSIIWLSLSARALRENTGDLLGFEGIVEDVTARKRTEAELRESRKRLSATYSQAAVGISEVDMAGRFLNMNDRFCEITGYSREDLLSLRFQDITHPDDIHADAELFGRLWAGEIDTYRLEKRYIHRDGPVIWIELNASLVRDDSGQPSYRVAVVQDVSARKRAEEAAENARQKVEFLAGSSSMFLSGSVDPEGILQQLTELWVPRIADLCAIDMLDGDGTLRRMAVMNRDPAKLKLARELQERYPLGLDDPRGAGNVVRTGRAEFYPTIPDELLEASARDAGLLAVLREWGLKSAICAPLSARGKTLGAATFITAESRRIYSEVDLEFIEELCNRAALAIDNARLYEAEQKARAAAEGAQQRLWFLAEANAVLSSSLDFETTLARVAGLAVPSLADCCVAHIFPGDEDEARSAISHIDPSKEELVRQLHSRYVPAPDEPHPLVKMIHSQTPVLVEDIDEASMAGIIRDEKHRVILRKLDFKSYMAVPLVARGRLFGAMTFAIAGGERRYSQQDVSLAEELARRAALALDNARLYENSQRVQEALRVALEAKDEFLGVMSHELRTPITAIYGGTRVLRSRGERLDDESKARLLEDIEQESERLFRMVENLLVLSRLELGQEVATEPVLAQRIIGKLASSFKQRRPARSLILDVDEEMEPVAAEPHYLEQVLRNLLTNADKYSPLDSPVEIETRAQNGEAEIVILDHGPGIAPEETETIFERFYRSDRTSAQAAGIGLGLTVCKRLMEAQAGRVWARPRQGGGLEVGITLPTYKEAQHDV